MSQADRIAIIGLGHRGYKTHFLSLHGSLAASIVAVCDSNEETLAKFAAQHPTVPAYRSVEDLIVQHQPDFAIVSLPHHVHGVSVAALSDAGIPILKEKPAADDIQNYRHLSKLPVPIGVACQRRFEPRYQQLRGLLPSLGRIVSFRAVLARNIEHLGSSWRSLGVGVAEDLGVHMIDSLVLLFGQPDSVYASKVEAVRQFQQYSGDDIADITFKWLDGNLMGSVHLSRVAHSDEESIIITGTSGTAVLDGNMVEMLDLSGTKLLSISDATNKQVVLRNMARSFGNALRTASDSDFESSLDSHRGTVLTMDAIKHSFESGAAEAVRDESDDHCPWPIIIPGIEKALIDQAHSSLSIYNRSNIYEVFEKRWETMHGLNHALACSSGTIAILHMFEALELKPGDEVLCPVYTFFATATPMLQYGAVPVFCDSLEDGNFDPSEILRRSTARTKAVIVTHMWGLPCRMKDIVNNARRANLKVLEDCSHAHTAIVDGKMVGAWGDMAAWSLQAKKNITGGQAGIFATNSDDYYARAVTHGHFNKRAKQEVPLEHPLRKFWLTGLGLNLRAHPLAIAMANVQLSNHTVTQKWREHWARFLIAQLQYIPFLRMPDTANQATDRHAWYAFVMQFDETKAPKDLTRELFVSTLEKRGLSEVDIPRSTGLLHDLPLFTDTASAIPRFGTPGPWKAQQSSNEFPRALAFYKSAIKLPMWSRASDSAIVRKYAKVFLEVSLEFAGRGREVLIPNMQRDNRIEARL